jgi:hypothetical protein
MAWLLVVFVFACGQTSGWTSISNGLQGSVRGFASVRGTTAVSSTGRSRLEAATAASASSTEAKATLEVCFSPGCVADGAEGVLTKLSALTCNNESIVVARGVCCSLCGNGPVAIEPSTGKKHRRLNSNQKLLELLRLDADKVTPSQTAVLEGIDQCLRGDVELSRNNYKGALQHYANGIGNGMAAAIELSGDSSNENSDDHIDNTNNQSLDWVIRALSSEATCKLRTGDVEGAIVSAGTAHQLSQKRSQGALEVLQEVYQSQGDDRNELAALEALTALYEEQAQAEAGLPPRKRKRLTVMEENQRRNLGFRLSTLRAKVQ